MHGSPSKTEPVEAGEIVREGFMPRRRVSQELGGCQPFCTRSTQIPGADPVGRIFLAHRRKDAKKAGKRLHFALLRFCAFALLRLCARHLHPFVQSRCEPRKNPLTPRQLNNRGVNTLHHHRHSFVVELLLRVLSCVVITIAIKRSVGNHHRAVPGVPVV